MLRLNLSFLDYLIEYRRGLAKAAAAFLGLLLLVTGGFESGDKMLRLARDAVRSQPASGQVHIVEIDARSLSEIDRWPWPRRVHAQLIDRLQASNLRSLAFDVDFSSLSNPDDDADLARALEGAGGSVILPTFRQQANSQSSDYIDNIPAKPFRDNAFLAAVTVLPDADGNVRRMPLGIETLATPRPSLASLVAERQAEIGRSFTIDYSIDPSSIPRHSFVDVIRGRVDPALLEGKRVLVGATAVEMGDRYAVPGHGVIPGVVIQALAAETLLAGPVPSEISGLWPLLLAMLLIVLVLREGSRPVRILAFASGLALLLIVPLIGESYFALSMPLVPALAAMGMAALTSLFFYSADRFRHRTLNDPETGLPNARALERDSGAGTFLVIVARIDRFAELAAALGPEATTALIHRVSDRLGFGQNRPIYRVEQSSLAWIEEEDKADSLPDRLEGLSAVMRSPVDCGRLVDVSVAFGIAEPVAGGSKQQIANAALAAFDSARAGLRWDRFVEDGSGERNWHLSLLGELDAAMAAGQVWNAYQPKLEIASGRIIGVEALVRWEHPERGPIMPDQFIPLVEEHGHARDLTLHVFDTAMRDLKRWTQSGLDLVVAVNVSTTLLLDQPFVTTLSERLLREPELATRITIEVTESAAMVNPDRAIAALESWRSAGAHISIDDYGTGQSSLNYLQKLPASELKIDRSFVSNLVTDQRNAIMVRSTIALAHELGMRVVAEGIEDRESLARLAEMGCDIAQGWHVGRPMPAERLDSFLLDRSLAAA